MVKVYVQQRIEVFWYLYIRCNPGSSNCKIELIAPDHEIGHRPDADGTYELVESENRTVVGVKLTDNHSKVTRTLIVTNPQNVFTYKNR